MIITESDIYWITRLDAVKIVAVTSVIISLIGTIVACVALIMETLEFEAQTYWSEGGKELAIKSRRRLTAAVALASVWLILSIGCAVFTPSTAEMAAIKILPAINNSEFVQETMPAEIRDLYRIAKQALTGRVEKHK